MSAKILQRKFLLPEGLGSFETVLDDPLLVENIDPVMVGQYVDQGEFTLGAFIALLNDNNKLIFTISSKEDLEAVEMMRDGLVELCDEIGSLFQRIEEAVETRREEIGEASEDATILSFPSDSKTEDNITDEDSDDNLVN